jgi:transposase-like protein
MAHRHQPKRFDARLNMNVSAELRAELDAAAKQSGELMSAVARRVLVEWATARVVARGSPATMGN